MYANLILLERPSAEIVDGNHDGRLWSGHLEAEQFPCWCEYRVVAEISLEDGEAGPFSVELRLTDLINDEVHVVRSWEIERVDVAREYLMPHVHHYVIDAEMGVHDPGESELSLWVDGVSSKPLARRCIAVTRAAR